MSNALTIAAVTVAFGRTVSLALNSVPHLSAAPELRFGRPSSEPNFVGAALFLYRVSPNGARRNDDLATRSHDGILLRKPSVALDLQYLLSFHGEDATLEAQRMMGAVVCALQADPFLSAEQVNAAVTGSGPHGPLAGADYSVDAESVRLSLTTLDPEMMHKVWALFPQTNYTLSLVYTATAVVLDAPQTPLVALPTRSAVTSVTPKTALRIQTISPSTATVDEVVTLAIVGAPDGLINIRFNAPGKSVVAAQRKFTLSFGQAICSIPSTLECGFWDVSAALDMPISSPTQGTPNSLAAKDLSFSARTSPPQAFMLLPRVRDGATWRSATASTSEVSSSTTSAGLASSALKAGVIVCGVNPALGASQDAILQLDPISGANPDAKPASSIRLLRTIMDGRYVANLDRGDSPTSLEPSLVVAGATSGRSWTVTTIIAGQSWRLTAGTEVVRATFDGSQMSLYGGLASTDGDDAIAFSVPPLVAADYLIRISVGGPTGLFSPLRLGARLPFDLPEGASAAALGGGAIPAGLADRLLATKLPDNDPIDLGAAATARQPMAGDGWVLTDSNGIARVWLRLEGGALAVFALDVKNGTYFGPSVAVPSPPGSNP